MHKLLQSQFQCFNDSSMKASFSSSSTNQEWNSSYDVGTDYGSYSSSSYNSHEAYSSSRVRAGSVASSTASKHRSTKPPKSATSGNLAGISRAQPARHSLIKSPRKSSAAKPKHGIQHPGNYSLRHKRVSC